MHLSAPMSLTRGITFCLFTTIALPLLGDPSVNEAHWQSLSRMRFREAQAGFSEYLKSHPKDEEAMLGLASSFLNDPEHDTGKLQRARALLEGLSQSEHVETRQSATYLLGRYAQHFGTAPDLDKARFYYDKLVDEDAGSFYGGLALLKTSTIQLAGCPSSEAAAIVSRVEGKLELISDKALLRNLHRLLGEAAVVHRLGSELAWRHFQAAAEIGFDEAEARSDAWLRAAFWAEASGKKAIAVANYREFANLFPRDARANWASLKATSIEEGRR